MNIKTMRHTVWMRCLFMAAFLFPLGSRDAAAKSNEPTGLGANDLRKPFYEGTAEIQPPELGSDTLSRERLIHHVLDRNPSVETARQALYEVSARVSQVTAYADPTISYEAAPNTIGSGHGYGQVIRLQQRFEWPGKQALRGSIVLAEAEARSADLERVRLHLRTTASLLFDDYFSVGRALDINRVHRELVTRLRQGAEAQYAAGRGGQQDTIQADVELALLESERLSLSAREKITIARINALLHRSADARLPAAPTNLELAAAPPWDDQQWYDYARRNRPELRAAARRVAARKKGVALARLAFNPDFSIRLTHNSMWPQVQHQFMVGVSLDIPVQFSARRGLLNEATATLLRSESNQAEHRLSVVTEVRQALVRFEEALSQAVVSRDQVLPIARQQIQAAEAGYTSGRNSFSDIMSAQRQLRRFEQAYAEAMADTWRTRALLTRASGLASIQPEQGGLQ